MTRIIRFIAFSVMLLAFCLPAQAQNHKEKLIKKWELIGIEMATLKISEQELKAKRANSTMELFGDGRCMIIPQNAEATIKRNRWTLEEAPSKEVFLVIETLDDMGQKYNQTMKVETLSKKILVLSVGKEKDLEKYTYKVLK